MKVACAVAVVGVAVKLGTRLLKSHSRPYCATFWSLLFNWVMSSLSFSCAKERVKCGQKVCQGILCQSGTIKRHNITSQLVTSWKGVSQMSKVLSYNETQSLLSDLLPTPLSPQNSPAMTEVTEKEMESRAKCTAIISECIQRPRTSIIRCCRDFFFFFLKELLLLIL